VADRSIGPRAQSSTRAVKKIFAELAPRFVAGHRVWRSADMYRPPSVAPV